MESMVGRHLLRGVASDHLGADPQYGRHVLKPRGCPHALTVSRGWEKPLAFLGSQHGISKMASVGGMPAMCQVEVRHSMNLRQSEGLLFN